MAPLIKDPYDFYKVLIFKWHHVSKFEPNHQLIGQVGRVFTTGPGDLGSIPCHVKLKTLKMVLDASLLNAQQYKVCIKGQVEQSTERSSTLPYTSV